MTTAEMLDELRRRFEDHAKSIEDMLPEDTEGYMHDGSWVPKRKTHPAPKPLPCPFCGASALPDASGCGWICVRHEPHCALWAAHSEEYKAAAWNHRAPCPKCAAQDDYLEARP
jgi:hypothetical protein